MEGLSKSHQLDLGTWIQNSAWKQRRISWETSQHTLMHHRQTPVSTRTETTDWNQGQNSDMAGWERNDPGERHTSIGTIYSLMFRKCGLSTQRPIWQLMWSRSRKEKNTMIRDQMDLRGEDIDIQLSHIISLIHRFLGVQKYQSEGLKRSSMT